MVGVIVDVHVTTTVLVLVEVGTWRGLPGPRNVLHVPPVWRPVVDDAVELRVDLVEVVELRMGRVEVVKLERELVELLWLVSSVELETEIVELLWLVISADVVTEPVELLWLVS